MYVTGYTKTGLIAQNKILRNKQKFITYKKWLLDRQFRLNRLLHGMSTKLGSIAVSNLDICINPLYSNTYMLSTLTVNVQIII